MKKISAILLLSAAFTASAFAGALQDTIGGDLVRYDNGKLVKTGPSALDGKKYVAVYYSAHWCPPCRGFTPKLVDFYNQQVKDHPEFELVFVSSDKSEKAMAEYMEWGDMDWLAIDYDQRKKTSLRDHAASGIPYMVVLDAEGKVVIEKPVGERWQYPGELLPKIEKLLDEGEA